MASGRNTRNSGQDVTEPTADAPLKPPPNSASKMKVAKKQTKRQVDTARRKAIKKEAAEKEATKQKAVEKETTKKKAIEKAAVEKEVQHSSIPARIRTNFPTADLTGDDEVPLLLPAVYTIS